MNKSSVIKALLDRSTINVKDLMKKLEVTRSNYYLWQSGKSIPRIDTINKLAEILNIKLKWIDKNNIEILDDQLSPRISNKAKHPDLKNIEKQDNNFDLINYQRKEIIRLKNENLKLKQNPVESILFEEQSYDWMTTVDIKFSLKGIKRRISKVLNIEALAKYLKSTPDELMPFFDINQWYIMNEHPVNNLITRQSLKDLESKTDLFKNIITQFKDFGKFFSGDHYITLFVDYKLNNVICKTINHCKIIESDKISINNKITILRD